MIVTCEGCETNFHVDDRLIRPTGSKVRCSKCRQVFFAYPPQAAAEAEEPLVLSDELPDLSIAPEALDQEKITPRLDRLLGGDIFGKNVAAANREQESELPDLDHLLEEDALTTGAFKAKELGDDQELNLDLGLSLEDDKDDEKADIHSAAVDNEAEIDFSLDLVPADESESPGDLPSLEELELDLEEIDSLEEPAGSAGDLTESGMEAIDPQPELDLDLGSMDSLRADILDSVPEEAGLETPIEEALGRDGSGQGDSLLDELNLDLGLESDEKAAVPAGGIGDQAGSELEDELDLSDLEAMLEGDSPAAAKTPEATEGVDFELDLEAAVSGEGKIAGEMEELDLSGITADPESSPAADLSSGLEPDEDAVHDLEAGGAPEQIAGSASDELDFSDITDILGKEGPAAEIADSADTREDLDLVFDEEPVAGSQATPAASEIHEDLMLDLEKLIESDEEKTDEDAEMSAEATDELDLPGEPAAAAADDIEVEIEPVMGEMDVAVPAEATASMVFSRSWEKTGAADDVSPAAFTAAGLRGATDILESESAAAPAEEAAAPRRSGIGKLLATALGVLVLIIAALVIPRSLGIHIPYLSELDIEIPIVGKVFQSEPQDTAGNLKMIPMTPSITAEFIHNDQAGSLCVIKGLVKNNYDQPRNYIQVTGKLYTRDKKMAKSLTGYAGTELTKEELSGLDLATITNRLGSRNGANDRNVGVKPGATVPFMLVFDQLPNDLDEYSVEVASSSK